MPTARPEASVVALTGGAHASSPKMVAGAMGQAGSSDALARLEAAMSELKALAAQPLLNRAVNALKAYDYDAGCNWALQALEKDERNGFGWYLLGIARERVGDFATSVQAYESALALIPDHAEIANDLGRLAYRMGMREQAEKLFRHFLARHPNHYEGANNLACAIRDQGRAEESIEILRPAILEAPEQPMLWNTLGTVVGEQGDLATSITFFEEAMRLDPTMAKAVYNRANARMATGDLDGALADVEVALEMSPDPNDDVMMRFMRATAFLLQGRLKEGWDQYEVRLDHNFGDAPLFPFSIPRLEPGMDVAGKRVLAIGEQGLGDEVLFANVFPDLIRDIGPDGQLCIACEQRLVPLFARSFPEALVGAHGTGLYQGRTVRAMLKPEEMEPLDMWAPMASLLRGYRDDLESFPKAPGYLKADPDRVDHWRRELAAAPEGKKVGLLWKSAVGLNARHRFFSPFEQWAPVLKTPGVTFVNLQYGDCDEELAWAKRELGVEIWTPPGVDLKQDLDDISALTCALDLTIGFANATVNLAAACGAPTWLVSPPGAWPRLGTDRYPWYPQMRVFVTDTYGEWAGVMAEMAEALPTA